MKKELEQLRKWFSRGDEESAILVLKEAIGKESGIEIIGEGGVVERTVKNVQNQLTVLDDRLESTYEVRSGGEHNHHEE